MKGTSWIAGVAISVGLSTGTLAADIPPATVADAPTVADNAPFDWGRFYVGAIGGLWFNYPVVSFDTARTGIVLGRNIPLGQHFLVGVEATVGVYDFSAPTFEGFVVARAGVTFARTFIYASAARGYDPVFGPSRMLGAGVELALADSLTVRGDAAFWSEVGAAFSYFHVTGGLSWYLGR